MSNHNGNANKMVDTPRTDRAIKNCHGWHHVPIEMARELERELNAANDKIKQLEDNRTKAAANSLANMLAYEEAIAKIKRLEEVGKELRECAGQLGWTSSDDSRWIERAEAAVKVWDKEAKAVKQSKETHIKWRVFGNPALSSESTPKAIMTIHPDGRVTTSDRLKPTEAAALVLDQIKTQWLKDAQATKIRELQEQNNLLEDWKQSALAVEREWNANAIATMLGGRLGESQREVIQREVPKLLDRIKRLEEAVESLLPYAEATKDESSEWSPGRWKSEKLKRIINEARKAKEAKP